MAREGLGVSDLATRVGRPKSQPKLHRFWAGDSKKPDADTLIPVADYFGVPLQAFYEEKAAKAVAKERGLSIVPIDVKRRSRSTGATEVADIVAKLKNLSPADRQRVAEDAGLLAGEPQAKRYGAEK